LATDHVVAFVGDEQVARGIDGNALAVVQLGGGRRGVVTAVTGGVGAGDGDDVAGRLYDLSSLGPARTPGGVIIGASLAAGSPANDVGFSRPDGVSL
jgi:hypothetical protein